MPIATQMASKTDDATPRIYQQATITKLDAEKMWVRCSIPGRKNADTGNPIESPWVRVAVPLASQKGYRNYGLPQIGDAGVLILNQNSNKGIWVGGYYNDERPAPYSNPSLKGWKHDDGAEHYYDANAPRFFETTPGDRVTHANVNQTHTADLLYEIEAEVVQIRTKSGASLTLTKLGAIVFQNAIGQSFILGDDTGVELLKKYTFSAGDSWVHWDNVGKFTLNNQPVCTVTHLHPYTDQANTPGTYPTIF
jgi:phage baseplate assembly protein gpV